MDGTLVGEREGDEIVSDEMSSDANKRLTKTATCPHCGGLIKVHVSTRIEDVAKFTSLTNDWRDGLSDKQIDLVNLADSHGIISAFEQAVSKSIQHDGAPKNTRKYFLTFLSLARPKMIPRWAMSYYNREFRAAKIEAWAYMNTISILADGCIRVFVPAELIAGRKIKSLNIGNPRGRIDADPKEFQQWNKTRFGWVVGKSALYSELSRRSFGEFDNISNDV